MTKLKDVIHFYLGCTLANGGGTLLLTAVRKEIKNVSDFKIAVMNGNVSHMADLDDLKPILRHTRTMTAAEKDEFCNFLNLEKEDLDIFKGGTAHLTTLEDWTNGILWLTKNGFDIFGLIESGQAIEGNNINKV